MKGYLYIILALSVVAGIINALVSSKSKLKKYVSFTVSIACTLSLLSPLFSLISEVGELKKLTNEFFSSFSYSAQIDSTNDMIINETQAKIEKGIKDLVVQKFKFDENEVKVELNLDKGEISEIKIEKINVYVSGKASWSDTDEIKKYLENVLSGEIIVKRR